MVFLTMVHVGLLLQVSSAIFLYETDLEVSFCIRCPHKRKAEPIDSYTALGLQNFAHVGVEKQIYINIHTHTHFLENNFSKASALLGYGYMWLEGNMQLNQECLLHKWNMRLYFILLSLWQGTTPISTLHDVISTHQVAHKVT